MRKLFVLLSSVSISLSASLYVPEKLGSLALFNSPQGFAVLKDNKVHHLGPEAVDSTIRKMDFNQRNMYLMKGGSLALNQTTQGDYILRTAPKLKGGGLLGASIGAKIGYFTVHFIAHTGMFIASLAAGPLQPAALAAMEATALPFLLVAAKGGAIAGGIIGGVATGPV